MYSLGQVSITNKVVECRSADVEIPTSLILAHSVVSNLGQHGYYLVLFLFGDVAVTGIYIVKDFLQQCSYGV